ncbi:unnamed protein product [Calicophoron daubneyi]|uniref:Ig-like domain-containing protein n=1 Tax=Calicophoron daubneyi TaxID=300641 RepID=A0AAV2U072_CALDB
MTRSTGFIRNIESWTTVLIVLFCLLRLAIPKPNIRDHRTYDGIQQPPPPPSARDKRSPDDSKTSDQYDYTKVEAVVNSTAFLPCRPTKKSKTTSSWEETEKGKLLWKSVNTNEYLIYDNRRLYPDTRFIVDMSSFDQTVMDLRIDNVQLKDEGTYICLYSTGQSVYRQKIELVVLGLMYGKDLARIVCSCAGGPLEVSKNIYLLRTYGVQKQLPFYCSHSLNPIFLLCPVPPSIIENSSSPDRVIVQEWENTVLHCKAWGVPQPKITWYVLPQEGPPRQLGQFPNARFTVKSNLLVITNVTRDLHGLYKCLATNGLEKTASHLIQLDVQFPPTIRMANRKIGQFLHRTTMVRALIKGNPISAFYWEFGRRPIEGPNSNCIIPMPNEKYCIIIDKLNTMDKEVKTTLFIANLTNSDYGQYTCVVETPFGIFRNSTEVFRTNPPQLSTWEARYEGESNKHSSSAKSGIFGREDRKFNEKINKRATYLTINTPRRADSLRGHRSMEPPETTCHSDECQENSTVRRRVGRDLYLFLFVHIVCSTMSDD